MTESTYTLPLADITWESGTPVSNRYGDIYWTKGEPLEEKVHVFTNQHQLESRIKEADFFAIAETGFGFGNNFLLTAERWRSSSTTGTLFYIAIENNPVGRGDLLRHLEGNGLHYAAELLAKYPLPVRGQHILWLDRNIRLQLIFEDASTALEELDANMDAWYLDGFSPAKNPAMWDTHLFTSMARLSKPGATVSSYSVARRVRDGLESAGFTTRKTHGFGNKSEMLVGQRQGIWRPSKRSRKDIAIVGSGLAAQGIAHALDRRRNAYRIISEGNAGYPSGIPALTCYPQLTAVAEERARFSFSASSYMQQQPNFQPMAIEWRSRDTKRQQRMARIAKQFPDEFASGNDPVTFHQCGWLTSDEIPFKKASIRQIEPMDHAWRLRSESGETTECEQLVIATGALTKQFVPDIDFKPIRGQSIIVRLPAGPNHIVTGDITLIPLGEDLYLVGSSYGLNDDSNEVIPSDTQALLESLLLHYPQASPQLISAHAGVRAAIRDRLPLVGPVPDNARLQALIAAKQSEMPDSFDQGLYLSFGFGSRGASHAGLAGEHLVNQMLGEPGALNLPQQKLLSVERFALRNAGL